MTIQRQFEDADGGVFYVESHDDKYIGHFRLRRLELSLSRRLIEIERAESNIMEIIFDVAPSEYEEIARVIQIFKSCVDDR